MDLIDRQAAIDALGEEPMVWTGSDYEIAARNQWNVDKLAIETVAPAKPEPFVDADKLKRCRFEYINACKIVTHPTPDTSKNDIHDAYAVIKALHPIFGDVEF